MEHRLEYVEAIRPILSRMNFDVKKLPREFGELIKEVSLRLGDPSLNAASARRGAGIEDPSILRRFRRHAGVSLTRYIEERRMETTARLAYSSSMTLEDVASMLGFASAGALESAIESWIPPLTLADLQEGWTESDTDFVVWRWGMRGEATPEQYEQLREDFYRLYPHMRPRAEES